MSGTVEVERDGAWVKVHPKELTRFELAEKLSSIIIDSDEFISTEEKKDLYAALNESIRRINKMTRALESVYKCAEDGTLTIRESAFNKVCSALNKKVQRSKE